MKDEFLLKNGTKEIRLTVLKWFILNIALPLSPILVKTIIIVFTSVDARIIEPSELLYFSFVIGILLIGSINKEQSAIGYIIVYFVGVMCSASLILIVLIYTGDVNTNVTIFSAASAIICTCIGTLYRAC